MAIKEQIHLHTSRTLLISLFKEEVDGEEHNEEDAIQVSVYTFNLLWALVEGGTRQMLDRLIIPSVLAIVICVSSLL